MSTASWAGAPVARLRSWTFLLLSPLASWRSTTMIAWRSELFREGTLRLRRSLGGDQSGDVGLHDPVPLAARDAAQRARIAEESLYQPTMASGSKERPIGAEEDFVIDAVLEELRQRRLPTIRCRGNRRECADVQEDVGTIFGERQTLFHEVDGGVGEDEIHVREIQGSLVDQPRVRVTETERRSGWAHV